MNMMGVRPPKAQPPASRPPSSSSSSTANIYNEVRARLRSPRKDTVPTTRHHSHHNHNHHTHNHHVFSPIPATRSSFSDSRGTTASTSFSGSSTMDTNTHLADDPHDDNANILRGAHILRQQFLANNKQQHQARDNNSSNNSRGSGTSTPTMHNKTFSKTKKTSRTTKPPPTVSGRGRRGTVTAPVPERLFPAHVDILRDLMSDTPTMGNSSNHHYHNKGLNATTGGGNIRGVSAFDRTDSTRKLVGSDTSTRKKGEVFVVSQTTGGVLRRNQTPTEMGEERGFPAFPDNIDCNPSAPDDPWQATAAFLSDDDEVWNTWSVHDSLLTGPLPVSDDDDDDDDDDGVNDTAAKGKEQQTALDRTMNTTMTASDDEDLTVLLQQAEEIKKRGGIRMEFAKAAAEHIAAEDANAFDNFIDSVSLVDQALERLVDEEIDSRGRQQQQPSKGNYSTGIHTVLTDIDQDQLAAAKREAMMAMVGQRHQGQGRGRRPQRSYSATGGDMQQLPPNAKSRRAYSTGGGGHRQRHRRQSSLRDDLLCGVEQSCKTYTPEEEAMRQRGEDEDDGCMCGPPDEDEPSTIDRNPSGVQKQHHHHHRQHLHTAAKKNSHHQHNNHSYNHKVKGILKSSKNVPSEQSFATSTELTLEGEDKFDILSPNSEEYWYLRSGDPAFQHALHAGSLWQSLVGQTVRFPTEWWQGGHRTAPLGCNKRIADMNKWVYYDRHRIKGNTHLNKFIRRRDEPGQLLLHIVVRDFLTSNPIMDVVIGCFHPNAKSVRTTEHANKRNKDCRDVWLATRFRTEDSISVIDPGFLLDRLGQPLKTPLGDSKRRISNANVRTIYGESPPIRTVFVLESDIYETLASIDTSQNGPADVLLGRYVFRY